jgi:glycosyltransferase involved in cell wall biosynthesis
MLQVFRWRHTACPYDIAIIFNLKHPQIVCAHHAVHRLDIPVILEYEDDAFVNISGQPMRHSPGYNHYASKVLNEVSGCMACSPRLLSQLPPDIPKLLLRGVVGADLVSFGERNGVVKKNWVLFSGTHSKQYGIPSLIAAWRKAELPYWELHITGDGEETAALKQLAENAPGIHFHGLVSRQELVRIMCSAKICINPHDVSQTPGNVFAFKIIEYLAAGAHVITTPMGTLEEELEAGITYMQRNDPDTIATTLKEVIGDRKWEKRAAAYACKTYGPAGVSSSLSGLISEALSMGAATPARRAS